MGKNPVISESAAAKSRRPQIEDVSPFAAIPGGEFQIHGENLAGDSLARVSFGDASAPIVVGSDSYIVARVPEGASAGDMIVHCAEDSKPWICQIGLQVADTFHPVANPAVDSRGNVFTTFSGARGQRTPVSVFRVDTNFHVHTFLSEVMNATGLCFDKEDLLYISSRHEGTIYQATSKGDMSVYVEGMGIATGIAFDNEDNLYVGDRSGTIFKVNRARNIYVYATLEPSIAAYHLAFGPDGFLYVSGPTTSSYDSVYRVGQHGDVEVFYRGLGRPQGIAFDAAGRLYVAASHEGRRGIVRIDSAGNAELFLSGPNIIGLAFAPSQRMMVTTTSGLYRVAAGVPGWPMPNQA
jgi:sugar lactone lactonase YvrE